MATDYNKFQQKKVQCVKGSYYVYLPKDWAKKYGLDEDRRILLKRMKDDSIIIKAMDVKGKIDDSYIIHLDYNPETLPEQISREDYYDFLFNLYMTAYIIGFKRVIFESTEKISLELQNKITEMTKRFHGMVIISENNNKITIEDTTNSVNLKLIVKQILNKVGIQIGNLIEIFENYHKLNEEGKLEKMISELIKQDDQIDEHRYAIERLVHQIMEYPSMGIDLNITTVECLHYSECARMLERIGDYILKLARSLKEEAIDNYDELIHKLREMRDIFTVIQDYFFRNNALKFYLLIKKVNSESEQMRDILQTDHPNKIFIHSIRRIENICTDIAEIRINDIVARKGEVPL